MAANEGTPTDYSALLCRLPPPDMQTAPAPQPLAFLRRIRAENSRVSDADDTDASEESSSSDAARNGDDLPSGAGDKELIPPNNFAMVNSWLYRSSFPKSKHFPFLKTLGLRSVLCVARARVILTAAR